LLSHHRANLRAAKKRFTPEATANADAQEKRENKARKARKEAQDDAKSSSSSSDTDSSSEGGAGSTFGEGSSLPGKIAELIQRKLGIETTGAYDERTKERIEEFQKANGLEVDGIVGTQTLAALRGDESPPAPGAFTEADWTWLSSNQAGGGENRKEARKDAVPKPISSPAEDSLPEEKTKKLAEDGWDYHDGKWWPPGHPRNLREAIEQDDFHRKYGAGMDGTPDEATGHLQNRLTELGYDSGANDGRFGEKTKGAVAAFQKDHGLKEDGEVGATTKIALRGSDPDEVARSREGAGGVEVEDESQEADMDATSEDAPSLAGTVLTKGTGVADEEPDAAVSHLQKTIGAEADGRFGPETEKKLKATQRRYGLKADGVVGPKTGRLLDRMASKANPKKDEGEKKLDEAILERMEAGASGDTAAFTRARAKEKTLREASLRGFASDALREFYRLDDGTFAPKGRGKILKPGQQITLPHRAGSGKIAAKVEHVNGGRGLARISDGPDTGHLASVRATAPQGSRARPFPDPVKRLRDLPPGNPENPSQVAEVNAQNALDHINQAIAKGDDAAVQDYLDDMEANHAWADKNGHQPALSRYDMAKERGEHFLRTGEAPPAFQAAPVDTGEPVHKPGSFTQFSDGDLETMLKNTRAMGDQPEQADAMQRELDRRAGSQAAPIDFAGASDGQLDELIDSALDENGLPRSGRDRSIFHTALAEKKRRAKRAFETSRSDAAKEAASNSYAQVTGQRLTQEPAVQFAPPDDYVPNAGEKQMKEMGPGDTFYVGKHEEAYVWHKPTPGGPFIISKPVGGGKAKVFHQEFAPPFIGPSDPNGSPSTSAAPAPAPPATNEDDLYNALQSSLAKASAPKSSPARSSKGNLRNFKAMSDEKLMKLALEMKKHPDDVEAVKAITAELSSRADNTSSASAASVKKGDKVTHGDGILTHTVTKVEGDKATIKSPDNPSLGGGVESTVASSELKPAKTGNPGKVKLPKTHEPAKAKSKEEKIAAAWAAYDKKKADFDALPADTDKAMKAKAAAQMRAAKFRIKRVGGDLENRPDTGPVTVKSAPPKSAQTKDEKVPSPPDLDVDEEAQATEDAISVEAENLNLDAAGKELGEGWSGPTVNAALNKLETSGIVFDRENESPKTIAAVIKAAGFAPGDMKTTGTK
jgi:peptidoglycan hydrolase-like protein with peptidoglycan-binding domain